MPLSTTVFIASLVAIQINCALLESQQANQALPTIDLPYGSWQASSYNPKDDIYQFTNVRFAAPPTGDLRWAKPAAPAHNTTLQTGAGGGTCYQTLPPQFIDLAGTLGGSQAEASIQPGPFSSVQEWIYTTALPWLTSGLTSLLHSNPVLDVVYEDIVLDVDIGSIQGGGPESEDCLFLDLVVPGKAIRGEQTLPVINYIYGGAYAVGQKEQYNGYGLVRQSNGSVIYVIANYRLGALGFLAGDTIDNDPTAVANAGFWDQRATLEWIQSYIYLVGGNNNSVSLWGESAGAGSVLHHLVAFGGKPPGSPLFHRAFAQSPAYVPEYNTAGRSERQFEAFANYSGCSDLACLRQQNASTLQRAAYQVTANDLPEHFGFGPAVDGTLVRRLPDVELAAGNVVPGVESVMLSHCINEAAAFVPSYQDDNTTAFVTEVESVYDLSTVQNDIIDRYPPPNPPSTPYSTEGGRMALYVMYSYFTCHVRSIANAFPNASWVGQWSGGTGLHGSDSPALFHNATTSDDWDSGYQNYFLSHAITGDPNTLQTFTGTINWPKVTLGADLSNVLNMTGSSYALINDSEVSSDECDFWLQMWQRSEGVSSTST